MESFCGDGGIKVAKNSVFPNGQKHIAGQTEAVFGRGHGITPHTLRHALATRADQEGAALGDISAMLGHKSTRIRPQLLAHLRAHLRPQMR